MKHSFQSLRRTGFTLIEIITVIAAVAILAGISLPVIKQTIRYRELNVTRSEVDQIRTALENYHGRYSAYPPSNPGSPALNPLYYELTGVTNQAGSFRTLDSASAVPATNYTRIFNVNGVVNCSKSGAAAESGRPQNFLLALKSNRIGTYNSFNILVTSITSSDPGQLTVLEGQGYSGIPVCYVCPGVNNPGAYDLWVDIVFGGRTYRIANWGQPIQILN